MNPSKDLRIGVVVPAGNKVHAREFALMRPEGVVFEFREFVSPPKDAADFCDGLGANMRAPIEELKAWGAQAILLGCTTASMKCADPGFTARLEKIAGVPVITAAAATTAAFRALKLKNVAVTTPYSEGGNKTVSDFIKSTGVGVANIKGMEFDKSPELWASRAVTLKPEEAYDYCLNVDVPGADAMYFPCTGMSCLEALNRFEQKTGKSALSSVQAGYWATMRRLGRDGRKPGFGRLVETWDF